MSENGWFSRIDAIALSPPESFIKAEMQEKHRISSIIPPIHHSILPEASACRM
jgi:hypothetical protein